MKTAKLGKTVLEVSRVGTGSIPIVAPSMDEAVRIITNQEAQDTSQTSLGRAFIYSRKRHTSPSISFDEQIATNCDHEQFCRMSKEPSSVTN
jgi:hypothetical protein